MLGDGTCDQPCQTAACFFDRGDCQCHDGCDTMSFTDCPEQCLNYACGYASFGRTGGCSDEFALVLTTSSQAKNKNFFAVMDWPRCVAVEPLCNLDIMIWSWQEHLCAYSTNESGNQYACVTDSCLSLFGLCYFAISAACNRGFGPTKDECFECKNPYVRLHTSCLDECPRRYQLDPVFPTTCTPRKDDSSRDNSDVLYVLESSVEGKGTLAKPYGSLGLALAASWKKYSTIYLLGDSISLAVNLTSTNPELRSLTSLFDPLGPSNFENLTIQSLTCQDQWTTYCSMLYTEIDIVMPIYFTVNSPITFRRVVFTSRKLFEGLPAQFCPQIKLVDNAWYDIFGIEVPPRLVLAAVVCEDFSDYSIFIVRKGGKLSFIVSPMQDVSMRNLTLQPRALIDIRGGDVSLEKVHFTNFHTQRNKGDFGAIVQWQACAEGVCGSFSFRDGSVELLNNGVEYAMETIISPFLNAQYLSSVEFVNVLFAFNFIVDMFGSVTVGSESSLILLGDFYELKISNCNFISNTVAGGLIVVNSFVSLPKNTAVGGSEAIWYSKPHIVLSDLTFFKNLGAFSIIALTLSGDVLNIDISNLNFTSNALEGKYIMSLSSSAAPTEALAVGTSQLILNPTSGKKELVWIGPRQCSIVNLAITRTYAYETLFYINNLANVQLSQIEVVENGRFDDLILTTLYQEFLDEPRVVAEVPREFPPIIECTSFIWLDQCLQVTVSSLRIVSGHCNTGSCGLRVLGNTGTTAVTDYLSENNTCASGSALAFEADTIHLKIRNFVVNKNENAQSVMAAFGSNATVDIADSSFQDNTGSAVLLTSSLSFTARRVVFRNNTADFGAGGALLWLLDTSVSAVADLADCVFEVNSAINGGVLAITANGNSRVVLSIRNCQFSENKALLFGSAVYVGLLVEFGEQSIIEWTPFLSHRNEYGVIYTQHYSGSLIIRDCTFAENKGTVAAAIYIETNPIAKTVMERIQFLRNRSAPAILKSNSRVNSTFETHSCDFLDNDSANVVLEGGAWLDYNSTFAYTSQTHVTLSSHATAAVTESRFLHSIEEESGAAVHAMIASTFSCTDCVFENNTAKHLGGAVFAEQESTVTMRGCVFRNNSAVSGGAVLALSSSRNNASVIESALIEGNFGGMFGFILAQSSRLNLLNLTVRHNTGIENPGISQLMSTISIAKSRFVFMNGQTAAFLSMYSSSVTTIEDSEFTESSCELSGLLQVASASNLTITRSMFWKLTGAGVIAASAGSSVSLEEVTMSYITSKMHGSLIDITESALIIRKGTFLQFSQGGIFGSRLTKVEIRDSDFSQGRGYEGAAGDFSQCSEILISACTFWHLNSELRGGALLFESLEAGNGKSVVVEDCVFEGNSAPQGGAVAMNNQKVQFLRSSFEENSALQGGALDLTCTMASECGWTLSASHFQNNSASVKGGAIAWQLVKPEVSNTTFQNNSAEYGADIASYPISLHLEQSRVLAMSSVAPGQVATFALVASLRDNYGNIITIDNSSLGSIESTEVSMSGSTKVTAQRGLLTFKDFVVYARPNTTASVYLTSPAIEPTHAGDPDTHEQTLGLTFKVRDCVPGETRGTESCTVCSTGTYSFEPSAPCQTCPSNAQCLGGIQVVPNKGYWRSGSYSAEVLECPNFAACKGGGDIASNESLSYTGTCEAGYKGNLCQSCENDYSRTGKNKCGKCPNRKENIVKLVFIAFAMLIAITLMVWSTMRSATRPTATHSIMIRIFVNYMQLVLLVTEFKLSWPDPVLHLFDTQESVGTAPEQAYSIDCFLADGEAGSLVYYRKMISMAVLPVPLIICAALFWMVVALRTGKLLVMKRECAATIVILFFLILPSMVKALFSMFSCTEINPDEFWLTIDMDIRCWDAEHTLNSLVVAVPAIIVWVFAMPLACLAVLVKYRARQDEIWMKLQYGFLINGYRRRCYYWEFVILYRKILIICCAVFLNNSIPVQALTVQLLLLVTLFLQYYTHPYTTKQLNKLELWAITVADVTIYSGLYYLTDDVSVIGSWILFLLILTVNVLFVVYWIVGLLGYFTNIMSLKYHRLGQLLKPGFFFDKYIEDFVKHCPERGNASRFSQLQLKDCHRYLLGQPILVFDPEKEKYSPRYIALPTTFSQ